MTNVVTQSSAAAAHRLRPLVRKIRRSGRHLRARTEVPYLRLRNHRSAEPVTGDRAVAVSLTTYGPRLDTAYLAVESIGRGSVRPRRLILWLEDPAVIAAPPPELERLKKRGLELCLAESYGPHTKYYPYAVSQDVHVDPLVTADDDILYPRHWLQTLLDSSNRHPEAVSCYWANRIAVSGGKIGAYAEWSPSRTAAPRHDQLALGVSGVLYPPRMLDHLRRAGTSFLQLSPTADDIWLHWVALRNEVPVRQVAAVPRHFPIVPGSQTTALLSANVQRGRNDEWVRRLYTSADVLELEAAYDR